MENSRSMRCVRMIKLIVDTQIIICPGNNVSETVCLNDYRTANFLINCLQLIRQGTEEQVTSRGKEKRGEERRGDNKSYR